MADHLGLTPTGVDEAGRLTYSEAAKQYHNLPAFEKLGDSRFWTLTGAHALTSGTLSVAQGGKFGNATIFGGAANSGGKILSATEKQAALTLNAAANFDEPYTLNGKTLDPADISRRELIVAVPASTTPAQWEQIGNAIQYGKTQNVTVKITVVKP